jgi:hypothetical protein
MLLFLAIFFAALYGQKPSTLMIENARVKEIFTQIKPIVGPGLALISMLVMYILAGIKALIGLRKFRFLNPVVVVLAMTPLVCFGYQLLYKEKPYTDFARGIIGIFALPLFASSAIVSALALLWFILILLRRPAH